MESCIDRFFWLPDIVPNVCSFVNPRSPLNTQSKNVQAQNLHLRNYSAKDQKRKVTSRLGRPWIFNFCVGISDPSLLSTLSLNLNIYRRQSKQKCSTIQSIYSTPTPNKTSHGVEMTSKLNFYYKLLGISNRKSPIYDLIKSRFTENRQSVVFFIFSCSVCTLSVASYIYLYMGP